MFTLQPSQSANVDADVQAVRKMIRQTLSYINTIMQKPGQQQCVHAYLVQLLDPDFEVFVKSCNFAVVENKESIINTMNEYALPCLIV